MSIASRVSIFVILGILSAGVGCRKSEETSQPETPAPAATAQPAQATTVPAAAAPARESVVGSVDVVQGQDVLGWAAFYGKPEAATVLFYVTLEGEAEPIYLGSAIANLDRPDVNAALGLYGPHGFRFSLPPTVKRGAKVIKIFDGRRHLLNAFVRDKVSAQAVLLEGSPKPFELLRK